jgi:hypothetical protein
MPSSVTLYSSVLICIHNSLLRTARHCTALINATNRLLISLHYSTHTVFKSHVKSSQADFFECELPAAISYRQLLTDENTLNSVLGFPYRLCTDHAENSFIITSRTTSSLPRQSIGPLPAAQQRATNIRRTTACAHRGVFIEPLHGNDHVLLTRA